MVTLGFSPRTVNSCVEFSSSRREKSEADSSAAPALGVRSRAFLTGTAFPAARGRAACEGAASRFCWAVDRGVTREGCTSGRRTCEIRAGALRFAPRSASRVPCARLLRPASRRAREILHSSTQPCTDSHRDSYVVEAQPCIPGSNGKLKKGGWYAKWQPVLWTARS